MAVLITKSIVRKTFKVIFFIMSVFLVALIYLYYPRSVNVPGEFITIESERRTTGFYWRIIPSESARVSIGEEYNIDIPKIDFSKNYLLFADGRQIEKLTYTYGSKYFSCNNLYEGKAKFISNYYPHKVFFYKVPKIYIHAW